MAISMNINMILAKSIEECHLPLATESRAKEEQDLIEKRFFENLRYYLEMAERIHVRTYNYIGEMPASINPVPFTQGLFYGGNLKPTDKLKKVLSASTSSFGFVGLNEAQELFNQHSLVEDGDFAFRVMQFLNSFKEEAKLRDGINYAIYGTPAESLASTQVEQFKAKYGVIKKVSDREYFTNSFHMPVWAEITPLEKQNLEKRFFDMSAGGRIQYVRIPSGRNLEAVVALIERGISMGFYQGINLAKSYCDHGHQFFEEDYPDFDGRCPICGSRDITTINRVCGYLGYSRINGDSRMNEGKLAEIRDRKSM